jgi:RNA polymerase sigma factor FliA
MNAHGRPSPPALQTSLAASTSSPLDAPGSARSRKTTASAQALIDSCQGLVRSLAWKIHQQLPPGVDLDDLIAYGQVGLTQAATEYDPNRGTNFTTYAYYRVRGEILDGLSQMSWFSRRQFYARRYEHMAHELMTVDGEGDAVAESAEEGARWLGGLARPLAVACLISETGASESDDVADPRAVAPEDDLIGAETRRHLHALLNALPDDARSLIRLTYFEGLSLADAGRQLGLSRSWASRLHARTLKRLAGALSLLQGGDE